MSSVLETRPAGAAAPDVATHKSADAAAASEAPAMTDGFHLIIDALKLNGIDTIFGVPGIPITDLTRLAQAEDRVDAVELQRVDDQVEPVGQFSRWRIVGFRPGGRTFCDCGHGVPWWR